MVLTTTVADGPRATTGGLQPFLVQLSGRCAAEGAKRDLRRRGGRGLWWSMVGDGWWVMVIYGWWRWCMVVLLVVHGG